MALDRDAFFRSWIDTLFLKASWVDSVKQLTGITAVSQVWGERPEWYLWIAGSTGPFSLALHHTSVRVSDRGKLQEGLFAVKCYPYRQTGAFSSFSEKEQHLIQSDRFDDTNTPSFETRAEIPEALFSVGTLTISANLENSLSILTFETQDYLQVFQNPDKCHDVSNDGCRHHILRNLPGWEIGYPLFDRIGALQAFCARRPPSYYRITRAPGFENFITAGQKADIRPSQTSQLISASLLFSTEVDSANQPSPTWLPQLEPGEEILFEKEFSAGPTSPMESNHASVNPLWWSLATTEFACGCISTCGCFH